LEGNVTDATLIRRVVIRNYKSIADGNVSLGPLTFLVGPNGSGKSSFLDALGFVSDALSASLERAVDARGGIAQVRRHTPAPGPDVAEDAVPIQIRLEFALPSGASGHYSFRIHSGIYGSYSVDEEECVIRGPDPTSPEHSFTARRGAAVVSSAPIAPAFLKDRLYLVAASGLPEFRPVYDALSLMSFYHLDPERIAEVESPAAGQRLDAAGANIASVWQYLERHEPAAAERIKEYLSALLPGFADVAVRDLDPDLRLEFYQNIPGFPIPVRFPASSTSDGTLRAFGVLVSLFQTSRDSVPSVPLVGIEEPETALHPAALAVLLDALREASARRQVIVTSHSSDLLDNDDIDPNSILAVLWEQGATRLAPLSDVGRGVLQDRMSTVGELLRTGQLEADSPAISLLVDTTVLIPGAGSPR
jgi:predicted ATPase